MADAEDLKSSGDFSSCGFDSHPGHQSFLLKMKELFGPSLSVYLWCTHISPCRSNRFDEHRRTGKMIRAIQILGFLLLGPLLAPAQMSFPGDKERERICKELVRRSSLVVVAIPASQPDEIVDRAKLKAALAPGRVTDVAQLNDQVVGRRFYAKVVDVLKGEGAVKNGEIVKLFVSGGDMVSFDALNVVEPGKEAIFFLSRMSESDARLKDVGVLPPRRQKQWHCCLSMFSDHINSQMKAPGA